MILTDYYRFEKIANQKSKTRIDCTASSGGYEPFESLRNKNGDLYLYLGDNTYTQAGKNRKADLALSKTLHISSIYNPDTQEPYWYGDVKGTSDAILVQHHNFSIVDGRIQDGAVIDIYIARGQRSARNVLYNAIVDGEFDEEIDQLQKTISKSIAIDKIGKK